MRLSHGHLEIRKSPFLGLSSGHAAPAVGVALAFIRDMGALHAEPNDRGALVLVRVIATAISGGEGRIHGLPLRVEAMAALFWCPACKDPLAYFSSVSSLLKFRKNQGHCPPRGDRQGHHPRECPKVSHVPEVSMDQHWNLKSFGNVSDPHRGREAHPDSWEASRYRSRSGALETGSRRLHRPSGYWLLSSLATE